MDPEIYFIRILPQTSEKCHRTVAVEKFICTCVSLAIFSYLYLFIVIYFYLILSVCVCVCVCMLGRVWYECMCIYVPVWWGQRSKSGVSLNCFPYYFCERDADWTRCLLCLDWLPVNPEIYLTGLGITCNGTALPVWTNGARPGPHACEASSLLIARSPRHCHFHCTCPSCVKEWSCPLSQSCLPKTQRILFQYEIQSLGAGVSYRSTFFSWPHWYTNKLGLC